MIIPLQINTNSNPPFSAQMTLDGVSYTGAVTWNIAGQRWYLTLTDQSGSVLWSGGLIGSPLDSDTPMAPGIFSTSKLVFREDTGNFEVTP